MYSSPRPLPKMPRSGPSLLGTTGRGTDMIDRSFPPASPADHAGSLSAPQQQLANSKEIHRGKLSKLQCHPGICAPPDLFPPKLDAGQLSDSDEKHPCHPPLAPITPECLSGLTDGVSPILEKTTDEGPKNLAKKYSRRWLREKRGRRWVEEDYNTIAQCLRELR
jgi:hypothetical protein